MQELFATLFNKLSLKGPHSDEVKNLLADIEKQFPDQAERAKALRDSWLLSQGKPLDAQASASALAPPGMNFLSWKFYVPVLGALGLGGGLSQGGAVLDFLGKYETELAKISTSSKYIYMGWLALIGAMTGAVLSLVRNRGLVIPRFSHEQASNKLTVVNPGILGDAFFSAVAAMLTTWVAVPTLSQPNPAPTNTETKLVSEATTSATPTATAAQTPFKLTPNVIVSALIAAIGGAEFLRSFWERHILRKALTEVAKRDSMDPTTIEAIRKATTNAEAAALASGMNVPGVNASPTADAEAKFLAHFEAAQLKACITRLDKPLTNKGEGLTLEPLKLLQGAMDLTLKAALKPMPLDQVAAFTEEEFNARVRVNGVITDTFGVLLKEVHALAKAAKADLSALPDGWTLPATRLG